MTKKDFIALADALRPIRDQLTPEVLKALMGFCKETNPNFKAFRWLGYLRGECGPNGGKV